MSSKNFTLCVRSEDRQTGGSAADYSVSIPQIERGLYKCTFRLSADNTVVQELRVNWTVTGYFDTSHTGYATALTCTYDGVGVLYIQDPDTTLQVQMVDVNTGALFEEEHVLLIHMEKQ